MDGGRCWRRGMGMALVLSAALWMPVIDVTLSAADDANVTAVVATVAGAERIQAFAFGIPCWDCRQRELTVSDVLAGVSPAAIPPQDEQRLRELLGRRTAFIETLTKPCPFVADRGLLLHGASGPSVLLFSDACQTARLVTADGTHVVLVNFDPIAPRLLPLLTSFTAR